MLYVVALIILLLLALIVIRVGTVALMLTGVSRQLARFQTRSAFFGVGFTTSESDVVVNHPVRREIVLTLMLVGNAGFVTVVSTVVLSFSNAPEEGLWGDIWFRTLAIVLGLLLVWLISYSKWIERRLNRLVGWALQRFLHLEPQDYIELLHLASDYSVLEFRVQTGSWLAGSKLMDMRLADEGIMVLGVERADGSYIGAPRGSAWLNAGDKLVAYCNKQAVDELEHRAKGAPGDEAHQLAVERRRALEREAAKP